MEILENAMNDYSITLEKLKIIKEISSDNDILLKWNSSEMVSRLEEKISKYNDFAKLILNNATATAKENKGNKT